MWLGETTWARRSSSTLPESRVDRSTKSMTELLYVEKSSDLRAEDKFRISPHFSYDSGTMLVARERSAGERSEVGIGPASVSLSRLTTLEISASQEVILDMSGESIDTIGSGMQQNATEPQSWFFRLDALACYPRHLFTHICAIFRHIDW